MRFISFCLIMLTLGACSPFNRLRKSSNFKEKYAGAMNYYEQKRYAKASVLFESIVPLSYGEKEGSDIMFNYAYALYYQQNYLLSAYYFKEFARVYGRSPLAVEASYMHPYALYLASPVFSLDQTSTYEAIDAMQIFIERYPQSTYAPRAQKVIDELYLKLAK